MAATDAPATPVTNKSGLLGKLKIPLIVLGVVIAQFVVVYCFFPSSSAEPPPNPEKEAARELPAPLPDPTKDLIPEDGQNDREIELGDFQVTSHQAVSNVTIRVDFNLCVTVRTKDEAEFNKLLDARGKRLREQVILTIRSADMTDLTDAGLGLIKRRILATTNRLLGKPLIQSVVFTDFRFNEQ